MQRKNEINIKNSNQQRIGICHRLYNFIINTFFSPTPKSITLGHPLDSENDHQNLLQDQSSNLHDSSLVTSPDIVVEFRHNIEDQRIQIDEIARVDVMAPQEIQETNLGEDIEVISANIGKGKGPMKTVSIKENAEEYRKDSRDKQQQQQNDKNLVPVSRDEAHKPPVTKKHRIPRLLSVETNINEKSDAFIRSKKAAMRRTYSNDVKD